MSTPPMLITASPHLGAGDSTPKIMWNVVGSLVPIVVLATWFFGVSVPLVVAASLAGCLVTERLVGPRGSLLDGSGVITGVLLGLTLPAGLPLWMAFVGGAFGIAIGKFVFGGLGQNVFNPALLGRAFLQASFPVALTTWPMPVSPGGWWQLRGDNFALPFASARALDVVTGATPLGKMKFEHESTPLWDLVLGTTTGSLGETSGLLILVCGGYLALRNYLNWRIPASIFATVAVMATALHLINPRFPDAGFMLFSGGLMLGAMYMATDLVTSPVTNPGCWIFGAGIGALVVLIRLWGGLAEGVMYAILIMNAVVPFLNRWTQPRVFGTPRVAVRK
jgi:Na+-translocating ferredoxin:NAD+ oxidoreductase subunit D